MSKIKVVIDSAAIALFNTAFTAQLECWEALREFERHIGQDVDIDESELCPVEDTPEGRAELLALVKRNADGDPYEPDWGGAEVAKCGVSLVDCKAEHIDITSDGGVFRYCSAHCMETR